jgi:hypothetical protein
LSARCSASTAAGVTTNSGSTAIVTACSINAATTAAARASRSVSERGGTLTWTHGIVSMTLGSQVEIVGVLGPGHDRDLDVRRVDVDRRSRRAPVGGPTDNAGSVLRVTHRKSCAL